LPPPQARLQCFSGRIGIFRTSLVFPHCNCLEPQVFTTFFPFLSLHPRVRVCLPTISLALFSFPPLPLSWKSTQDLYLYTIDKIGLSPPPFRSPPGMQVFSYCMLPTPLPSSVSDRRRSGFFSPPDFLKVLETKKTFFPPSRRRASIFLNLEFFPLIDHVHVFLFFSRVSSGLLFLHGEPRVIVLPFSSSLKLAS